MLIKLLRGDIYPDTGGLWPIGIMIMGVSDALFIGPLLVSDIFSVQNTAYRKFKQFSRGNKKVKVSNYVFEWIHSTLREQLR